MNKNRYLWNLLAGIGIFLGGHPNSWAATFYVKPTGNDFLSGRSLDSAWKSIHKACTASVISPGDVVLIRAGTYSGANFRDAWQGFYCVMRPKAGTSGAPVTYRGYPGDARPVIKGDLTNNGINSINCVSTVGRQWIVLDGLEFKYGFRYGVLVSASNNITVKNCVFDSLCLNDSQGENPAGLLGLYDSPGGIYNITVDSCTFFTIYPREGTNNCGGVAFYSVDSLVVKNSTFYDVAAGVWLKQGVVLSPCCTPGRNRAIHIYGNTFYSVPSPRGMQLHAIRAGHSAHLTDCYIHHNVIYGSNYFDGRPIMLNFPSGAPDYIWRRRVYVYNNTIDCGGVQGAITCAQTPFVVSGADTTWLVDTLEVFNNIIYEPVPVSALGQRGAFEQLGKDENYVEGRGKLGPTFVHDWNVIYAPDANQKIFYWHQVGAGGARQWSLGEFRSNTPYGARDTIADPMFENRAARNYALRAGSPAATRGRSITLPGRSGLPELLNYSGAFPPGGGAPDSTPPTISNVRDSNLTGCSAEILWETDEYATSVVDYGLTPAYEMGSDSTRGYWRSHRVILKGLQRDMVYYYRARSKDGSGNEAVSPGRSFRTLDEDCNMLLGRSAAVCGTYSGYGTAAISDGTIRAEGGTASTWASDESLNPHWVEFSLGSDTIVGNVTIYWAWNTAPTQRKWMTSRQFKIERWNGAAFAEVVQVTNDSGLDVSVVDFAPPISTSRLRIYQPSGGGPATYRNILWVTEIEAYRSPRGAVADIRPPGVGVVR